MHFRVITVYIDAIHYTMCMVEFSSTGIAFGSLFMGNSTHFVSLL